MWKIVGKLFKYRHIYFILILFAVNSSTNSLNTTTTTRITTTAIATTTTIYDDLESEEEEPTENPEDFKRLLGYEHFRPMLESAPSMKVDTLWLQFEPPSKEAFYIFGVIYCFIFILGCGGNLFVIVMFCRTRNLLTPATTLVLNLAISDFLMLAKCPIAIYNNFKEGPILGDMGCRIYGFLGGFSGTASILTLTAIAIDRYYVVVHPMGPLRSHNRIRPIVMVIFIWIYSFMFAIVPALDIGFSVYVPEGFLTTCTFNYLDKSFNARVFMFTFFVCAYVIPLNIIFFSYFYILRVVYKSDRVQACQNRNRIEQKLALVVVLVILLWFVAWTPYSIVAMLGVFGYGEYLSPLKSMIPAIFCKTAACVDPYIYAATHPRFRMELHRFINQRLDLGRVSVFGSSFRTRSTANNRVRSVSELGVLPSSVTSAIEQNHRPIANMRNNNLEAVAEEEDLVQEEAVEIVAAAQVHNVDNCRY